MYIGSLPSLISMVSSPIFISLGELKEINLLRSGKELKIAAFACGSIVICAALLVIFGWTTKNTALIQIHPTFAPMQINTALCFLFGVISAFGLYLNDSRISMVPALFLASISSLTLAEYIFGIDVGIDMMFTDFVITTQTLTPGRMAPNTAICFLFIAVVLLWYPLPKRMSSLIVMQLMLFIVFLIGMTALTGYIFGLPYAYGWGIYTKMAMHTAILFMLLSLCLSFILALKNQSTAFMEKFMPPLAAFSITAFIFLAIWNAQLSSETSAIRSTVKDMQAQIEQQIYTVLDAQLDGLSRIGKRWEARGGTPQQEWMDDVKSYHDDFRAYRAIEWADPQYIIRWVQPLFGNEAALNFDLSTIPSRKEAMDHAKKTGEITATEPVDLLQGNRGIVVYVPLINPHLFDGYIIAVIDIPTFFNILLSQGFYDQFSIDLSYKGVVFYTTSTASKLNYANDYEYQNTLTILGHEWTMTLRPTERLIRSFQTMAPAATLLAGLLMALIIAMAWYFISESKGLMKQSKLILDSAQAGLLKASLLGECTEVNSQLCLLLDSTRKNIMDRGWLAYVDPSSQEEVMQDWHDAVAHHKDYAGDFKILRSDGTSVWVQCYASVLTDENLEPQAYIMTFYNIDSLKQTETKLKNLSYKDELTDLPNRRYFIEVLKNTLAESLRYRRKFTLIYIDVDYFKEINDTFGHGAGDALLRELGKRFKHLIRGTDFIARMGGDEFCLIMREASSPESIKVMLDRIMGMMLQPINMGSTERVVNISMGVVVYADESITYEELLARADAALYKAKTAGRNNVQFYA